MKKFKLSYFLLILFLLILGCGKVVDDNFDSPKDLTLKKIADGKIKLTWNYSSQSTKMEYLISRKQGESEWEEDIAFTSDKEFIDEIPTNSYDAYAYKVRAHDKDNDTYTAYSISVAYFSEQADPSNLTISQLSQKYIKLEWIDNCVGEDGFIIDKKIGDEKWLNNYKTIAENVTSYTDSVTSLYTTIKYRLRAFVKDSFSDYVEAHIVPSFPAPADLIAQQVQENQIRLQWTVLSEGENGFGVERKIGLGEWTLLTKIPSPATEWVDMLDFETGNVSYRVFAYNNEQYSAYSKVVTLNYNINEVSTIFLSGRGLDLCVSNNYAFIASDFDGIKIYDISNQQNPSLFSNVIVPGRSLSVAVRDTFLVVGNHNGGINLFSIADMNDIKNLGVCSTYGEPNDIEIIDISGELYACVADGSTGVLFVKLINTPIPTPVIVKVINTNGLAQKIAVDGNKIYVAVGLEGLISLNINGIDDITVQKNKSCYLNAIASISGYIFGSSGDNGILVYDGNNELVSNYDSYGYSDLIVATSDYCFFYDVDRGIIIVDISNKEQLNEVANLPQSININSLKVKNSYLYCVGDNLLKIIQIVP